MLLHGPICTTQCKAADLVRRVGLRSKCQYLHNCFGLEQEKALVCFTGWSWSTQTGFPLEKPNWKLHVHPMCSRLYLERKGPTHRASNLL